MAYKQPSARIKIAVRRLFNITDVVGIGIFYPRMEDRAIFFRSGDDGVNPASSALLFLLNDPIGAVALVVRDPEGKEAPV